jgi:predicted porin
MRYRLLHAIPIVALALPGDPAAGDPAADPVAVHIDGQLFVGFGGDIAGDPARGLANRPTNAEGDLLVRLRADRRFDDVTLGLVVRLRGEEPMEKLPPDAEGPVKDAYLSADFDAFGEFRLGESSDVRRNKGYKAPQICDCLDSLFGTNAPQVGFDDSPVPLNTTIANIDRRAAKLAWYSPVLDGFQLGLSYAPEAARGPTPADPADPAPRDFASAALSWDHRFDDVSLGLEAGMTDAKQDGPHSAGRLMIWDVGGRLEYGPWKFGGAFEQQHGGNALDLYGAAALLLDPGGVLPYRPVDRADIVTETFDLGFTYSIGPVTAGIAWSRGLYEGLPDPEDAKHAAANDMIFAGGDYQVDPRLSLLTGLQYDRYDPGAAPAAAGLWAKPYAALQLVFGAALRF